MRRRALQFLGIAVEVVAHRKADHAARIGDLVLRVGVHLLPLALIELDKGPFSLTRHDPRTALRRLIASAAVPAAPPVWSAALAVIGRLAREVPCYGMAWSLEEPPFARLASALRL